MADSLKYPIQESNVNETQDQKRQLFKRDLQNAKKKTNEEFQPSKYDDQNEHLSKSAFPCENDEPIEQQSDDQNEHKIEQQPRHLFLNATEKELKDVDRFDIIKMDGLICKAYHHFAIVKSVHDDSLELFEFTTREGHCLKVYGMALFSGLLLLDPFGSVVQARLTSYCYDLKKRNATIIIVLHGKAGRKAIDEEKVSQRLKQLQRFSNTYMLKHFNCEHLVTWIRLGQPICLQLEESKWKLFAIDAIYSIAAAIHLVTIANILSCVGVPWNLSCVLNQGCLTHYNVWKVNKLKDLGVIEEKNARNLENSYCFWAIVTTLLAFLLHMQGSAMFPIWLPVLLLVFANFLGVLMDYLIIPKTWYRIHWKYIGYLAFGGFLIWSYGVPTDMVWNIGLQLVYGILKHAVAGVMILWILRRIVVLG